MASLSDSHAGYPDAELEVPQRVLPGVPWPRLAAHLRHAIFQGADREAQAAPRRARKHHERPRNLLPQRRPKRGGAARSLQSIQAGLQGRKVQRGHALKVREAQASLPSLWPERVTDLKPSQI